MRLSRIWIFVIHSNILYSMHILDPIPGIPGGSFMTTGGASEVAGVGFKPLKENSLGANGLNGILLEMAYATTMEMISVGLPTSQ